MYSSKSHDLPHLHSHALGLQINPTFLCIKCVRIQSFSGPYFLVFRLNVSLCISLYSVQMQQIHVVLINQFLVFTSEFVTPPTLFIITNTCI